jgi:hypothetical protein
MYAADDPSPFDNLTTVLPYPEKQIRLVNLKGITTRTA